jgi:hypothetical protein
MDHHRFASSRGLLYLAYEPHESTHLIVTRCMAIYDRKSPHAHASGRRVRHEI